MFDAPYDDGFRQKKIEDGIARGLIKGHIDPDGIVRYEITKEGLMQYGIEKVMGKMERDFEIHFGVKL